MSACVFRRPKVFQEVFQTDKFLMQHFIVPLSAYLALSANVLLQLSHEETALFAKGLQVKTPVVGELFLRACEVLRAAKGKIVRIKPEFFQIPFDVI